MNKNIWGKKCSCGRDVYDYFEEHPWGEEHITKEVVCLNCKKKNIITRDEARAYYNNLIYDIFKEVNGNVLDIGCGGGLLTKYLLNKKEVNKVVAIDKDDDTDVKDVFVKVDLDDFDESIFDIHFDYVVCRDVLMYLKDIEYTFSKLSKVSDKIILLNWFNEEHKNCLNKTSPTEILNILSKYYKNIEISYPSFYKWGYLIKSK